MITAKKITLAAASLAALTLLAACSPKTNKKAMEDSSALPDVIKIGFIGPLSGNAAGYGQDVKKGVDIYFEENPTIAGKPVQVIYEDGKCNGQDSASAAQKLVNVDKVQIILGGPCSGETLAAAPIAEQGKVLLLSPLSSSPTVTTAGDYIFRNYPSDIQVAKTLVSKVLKAGKKIALLTEQTDYAQGYRGAVKTHMGNAGQTLALDEVFPVDNTDFRTLLSKVKESGADTLIFIGQTPVTDGFAVKQAKELGMNVTIFGTDTIDGVDFFGVAKDAAEGVYQVAVVEDPSRPGYNAFAEKAGKAQAAQVFLAFGYDAAALAAQAIAAAGYDGTKIKDYFYSMPTYKGLASDVKFDANGDNSVEAGMKVAKGGKFVLVTETK